MKFYRNSVGKKFHIGNVNSFTEKKGLFLLVYVDDIKLAGKKQNIDPMWKILMKDVDLGEPTSFLDHFYLGCTQRECQTSKDVVDSYRSMFESRISAVGVDSYQVQGNLTRTFSHGLMTWKGHACMERCCELANKTTQPFYKVATPCIDDHQFKEDEMGSVGEMATVFSTLF